MIIKIDERKRKEAEKREMEHAQIVRSQIGGPSHSPIGKGAGITEAIGPNAHRMVETMMNPQFIEDAFGTAPLIHTQDRRRELINAGAVGKYGSEGSAVGMSRDGNMQYFAHMPMKLYITLMWTDPTIFQDEERLEKYLIKAGLAVVKPRD